MMIIVLLILLFVLIFVFLLNMFKPNHNNTSEDVPLLSVVSPKNVTFDERLNQYHYF